MNDCVQEFVSGRFSFKPVYLVNPEQLVDVWSVSWQAITLAGCVHRGDVVVVIAREGEHRVGECLRFLAAGRRRLYRSIVLSTNIEGGVQHGYFEYRLLPRIERQSEVRPRPVEEECGTCNCAILFVSMQRSGEQKKKEKQQQRLVLA